MGEVSVERAGGVATVVMNRPPANAMTPDFVGAICDAVAELGADEAVRAIVLRSALERFFMAGADLGNMAARVSSTEAGSRQVGVLSRRISVIERVPKPTVAAINGHALGGGCEIALCCDYRLMVDDGRATIGLTETTLGLLPGAGGTQRLPRLVGRGAALKMIIEGRRLKAPEALAIGLVDAAVAPDELDAAVAAKATQLAGLATRAVGLAKLALIDGLDGTLEEGLALESRAFAEVLDTEDIKEGVGAFLEKRTPSFRGR
jgi:enoyl-CoA hydratase